MNGVVPPILPITSSRAQKYTFIFYECLVLQSQIDAVRKQGFNCSVRYGLINSIRCQCFGCGSREV